MKLEKLKKFAETQGFVIRHVDFIAYYGTLVGNRIFLSNNMNKEKELYTLAHEIAHGYLHKDKGNTIKSPKHAEYEEQADRAANMILDLLSMDSDICVGGAN